MSCNLWQNASCMLHVLRAWWQTHRWADGGGDGGDIHVGS